VEDGGRYPSILMLTGENDPRVAPWHSRKMIARLQAASASGRPILLRTSGSTGHGIGTALRELVEEYVDIYGFLFHELEVDGLPRSSGGGSSRLREDPRR
jgi:prolyl oligopeptidase